MNEVDEVVAGLEPAMLNSLAEDGYRRNRRNDLSMIAAGRHRSGRGARTDSANAFKGRRPVLVGGIVAVGAAAAVAAVRHLLVRQ